MFNKKYRKNIIIQAYIIKLENKKTEILFYIIIDLKNYYIYSNYHKLFFIFVPSILKNKYIYVYNYYAELTLESKQAMYNKIIYSTQFLMKVFTLVLNV